LGSLLPLVVDVETLKSLGTPNKAKAKNRLHKLLDELYRQTGRYPMIYTSNHMWSKVAGEPLGFGDYPLWVACWKCDDIYLPRGWTDWSFWQAGQFKFSGGTKLDGNVYSSNMSRLRLERQRPMRIAGGATWATSRDVTADLLGYDGREVRYAIGERAFGPWRAYAPRTPLRLAPRQGKQNVRVQLRSFRSIRSPVLRQTIQLDSVPPTLWGPKLTIRDDTQMSRRGSTVPVAVQVGAADATSGLASTFAGITCDGRPRGSSKSKSANARVTTKIGRSGCTVRGRSVDVAGLSTVKRLAPKIQVIDVRRNTRGIAFKGKWRTVKSSSALNRTLVRATGKNAQAKLRFSGHQFAIVARKGPSSGRFEVIVDGRRVGKVDLWAKKGEARQIVYVGDVSRGKHTLKLRTTGTSRAKSKDNRVLVDAVLVLDRRK
jgi:hypothetical protein